MTPDYKSQSRGYSRDMSSAAINRRLDKVAELYELWKFLRTGKRIVRGQGPPDGSLEAGPDSGHAPD
jgi:hypothetical protein